ncbi:hypothetical protein GCM10020229_60550 [Kitasatospora albolonga]
MLAYGVHDSRRRLAAGLHTSPRHLLGHPKDSWYGTLLKGVFNFQPDPTGLQVAVWLLYLAPTVVLFTRQQNTPVKPAPAPAA